MKKAVYKLCLNLIFLLLFVSAVLSLSYPLGREKDFLLWLSRFDPWLLLSQWRLAGLFPVWGWLPLLVLIATAWWGRWFCRFICPFGAFMALSDYVGRFLFQNKFQQVKACVFRNIQSLTIPVMVVLVAVFSFDAGWVLFFTPLTLFSHELVRVAQGEWPILLFIIFIVTLLLSRIWCSFLCPTGVVFAFVTRLALRRHNHVEHGPMLKRIKDFSSTISRRQFFKLTAVLLLLGAGLSLKNTVKGAGIILRPPGALREEEFGAVCNRCSRCIQVCPTAALRPMALTQGLVNFETPEFLPRIGRCDLCQACQAVCPTGALVLTPVAATKIGTAMVDQERCLAWNEGKLCFLCGEQCPVQAIDGDELHRPTVRRTKCVGCGACENGCPVAGEAAIRVFGG
jgi:MauM/NapG family ferredoxin protein